MNLKNITLQEVINLVGPYQQASKELGIRDNNESYSFSGFKANEAWMLKYFPNKIIHYMDEEFPEIMEDWNNTPSIEKVKSYVKNFNVPKTKIMTGVPPCAGLSSMGCKKALTWILHQLTTIFILL